MKGGVGFRLKERTFFMNIIKRNGEEVAFNKTKIANAITKANKTVAGNEQLSHDQIMSIADGIQEYAKEVGRALSVEEIQDLVETKIQGCGAFNVARNYIKYRFTRELQRKKNTTDDNILSLVNNSNEEVKQENSNKNPTIASTQRDYIAGEVSKDISRRILLPECVTKAHDEGLIHFHDMDYFIEPIHNCCLLNLEDMLQNGTVISGTTIEKPHSFSTACNVATQIIAQVASNQYGGQSISLAHLAPFVEVSRQRIKEELKKEFDLLGVTDEEKFTHILETRLRDEIKRGVQTIQYQVITLMTTNGQAPFITVFMYLGEATSEQEKKDLALIIEETLQQRITGVKNEKGVYISPAFPKLIYVLDEDNITPDSPYWYLTELSAECTAKRMVPDYISAKVMRQVKLSKGEKPGEGDVYVPMGCRSFLTPDRSGNGFGNKSKSKNYNPNKPQYYGRFNQGVVTVNLPDIALTAKAKGGDIMASFWEVFDERMELCHVALQCRHERLKGTLSNASPIHWQYGALARLKKDEKIDKLLYGGYSTISLGYAGLWECVFALCGKKLTESEGEELGLAIMQKLNDYTAKWKEAEDIDYSLYGTPLESTTYKFAKSLQKRFGIIDGVSDRGYITNSYHIHVTEKIEAFAKLALESKFQQLSPGGAISYVEVPNMQHNVPAILSMMQFMYDTILYSEINSKLDYCQECGYFGEIEIVEDEDGKLVWECPNCKNRDQNTMNVVRRTCGYIGTQYWNQGRTQEIKERVLHVD